MRERTDPDETAPGWPPAKQRVAAICAWSTSGSRSRIGRSLLPRMNSAANRFRRIVEGRGENIDETNPFPGGLE